MTDLIYSVGNCPICMGGGDLVALLSIKTKNLVYYCPACETAWDNIPDQVDSIKPLSSVAPYGVTLPKVEDFEKHGLTHYKICTSYSDLNDLLS